MVQELHVLRCFSCETFQSHIVKKSNKWECKICGVKQSIKKVYGRGSGKDCRLHTQKLNSLKGQKEELEDSTEYTEEIHEPRVEQKPKQQHSSVTSAKNFSLKPSKWTEFVDESEINNSENNCSTMKKINTDYVEKLKSQGQKRKHISDTFESFTEKGFFESFNNFDSVDSNYSAFSEINTAGWVKKNKFGNSYNFKSKNFQSHSSRNLVDTDEGHSELFYAKTIKKPHSETDFKTQTDLKAPLKWAEFLKNEDVTVETLSLKSTMKLMKPDNRCSLQREKYLEDQGDKRIEGPSLLRTSTNHQKEKKISLKWAKYLDNETEGVKELSSSQESDDDLRTVSCNFYLNNDLVEDLPDLNSYNDNSFTLHVPYKKDFHKNVRSTSLHFNHNSKDKFDKAVKTHNESLKEDCSKKCDGNNEVIHLRKPQFSAKTSPSLPVFEQNSDLDNIDFQLDF